MCLSCVQQTLLRVSVMRAAARQCFGVPWLTRRRLSLACSLSFGVFARSPCFGSHGTSTLNVVDVDASLYVMTRPGGHEGSAGLCDLANRRPCL